MSLVHGKTARALDWECRQSRYTRLTFSFRIADVRKVGLKLSIEPKRKSILEHNKEQPVDPGFIIIEHVQYYFTTRSQLEIKMLVMSKNSLGSLVIKTRSVGRGKRGMGSKYKRVQFYTDLFQV